MAREMVIRSVAGDAYDMDVKGHTIRVDQPEVAGGTNTGPSPTDLWVASLGGCVAYYAGKYLRDHGLGVFVAYRLVFAVVVGALLLAR